MPSHKSDSGFTLLECLVALAIAGLALTVLIRAAGDGLFATRDATLHDVALSIAQSRVADALARPTMAAQTLEGNDAGGFHWIETDTLLERGPHPEFPSGALFRITVTVRWSQDRHRLSLTTLRMAAAGGDAL